MVKVGVEFWKSKYERMHLQAVKDTGHRFRETILALGGGKPPLEVFVAFRGLEPSREPLLRHNGLLSATAIDPYDRIWEAATGEFGLTTVSNEASSIKVTTPPDNPPPLVLQNAVTSSSTLIGINIITKLLEKSTPFFMATYFSEVTQLGRSHKRSFKLFIDSKVVSASIVPTFGAASDVYIANRIASASNQISPQADDDSTLPPLINAMEVYTLSGELTNGTNAKDVGGLGLLQNGFEVLKGWSGDPKHCWVKNPWRSMSYVGSLLRLWWSYDINLKSAIDKLGAVNGDEISEI
ncbi:hypothetical protein Pint_27765 [Pistacia integerrima]|uniref:Uncharacterized protein n=1 Tax=Pistacia integerrima TaxID=434235 RepID=A0ACC0YSP9_9ROSI|nr:hypothetical protein Pint_27765 [Pistacia integerrima]